MTAKARDDLRRASLRLTAQFTVLVLIILTIVGTVVYVLVSASVTQSNQRTLVAATRLDSPADAPDGIYLTFIDERDSGQLMSTENLPTGLIDVDALRSVAAGGDDVQERRTVGGRDYLILTTTAPTREGGRERVVQAVLDTHESAEELQRLATALIVGGAVALLLAFVAASQMARRAIRPMADALALQRRFVADASHELRTPLTLLSTRAQLLARRRSTAPPAEVTAAVDEIVRDTRALTEILEDLLLAADPRTMNETIPVDLVEVTDHAIALLHDESERRGITHARSGASAPVIVDGSRAALLRLVIALSTNALDHARSTVTVSVAAEGRQAIVKVADDGPGFPSEVEATAFERFASHRAASDTGGVRHYGLGLAIVAEIVQRHGGSVTIEHPASGAAIRCSFPLSHDKPGVTHAGS